jgi:hypothetical protein
MFSEKRKCKEHNGRGRVGGGGMLLASDKRVEVAGTRYLQGVFSGRKEWQSRSKRLRNASELSSPTCSSGRNRVEVDRSF